MSVFPVSGTVLLCGYCSFTQIRQPLFHTGEQSANVGRIFVTSPVECFIRCRRRIDVSRMICVVTVSWKLDMLMECHVTEHDCYHLGTGNVTVTVDCGWLSVGYLT